MSPSTRPYSKTEVTGTDRGAVSVKAEEPIAKALALMLKENVGMMPVMQDNKVAGMVRMSELFQEISKMVLGD